MKDRMKRYLALVVMLMGIICSTATTAFAYTDDQSQQNGVGTENVGMTGAGASETGTAVVIPENSGAAIEEEPPAGEGAPGETAVQGVQSGTGNTPFSVPGNGQLVDDMSEDGTKQFLTVRTKSGNTFFMVLDRSNNTENVYMLSMIDENDLAEFLEEEKETEKKAPSIILPETETKPEVQEPEKEVTVEEDGGMSAGTMFVVIILLLGGAGGYYYFKVLKPKREEEEAESENMELYDDGVYFNEDEDPEDADEDEE